MKKISFFLLFICTHALSQNRSNIWELSYANTIAYPNCEMRYIDGIMDTASLFRNMSFFETNASICDTSGNLIFYSNGLIIGNHEYDTVLNAMNFNPGWSTENSEPNGLNINQGVLFIPYPNNVNRYYVFSLSSQPIGNDVQPVHLSYSLININLDNGLGGIEDSMKNKYAVVDTLTHGGLTAVKHANGRDWWVIVREYGSNKYYKLLVSPEGVDSVSAQSIGGSISNDILVEASFSTDGNKLCFSNGGGTFDYMEFDRCAGEFFNPNTAHIPDSLPITGSAFSPSNRYLYLCSQFNLYQYDTWNINMVENVIHVASWDSFLHPVYHIPILFSFQQLAPDGKIYMGGWNGTEYLNVINSPDSSGVSCNFAPHSYILPQYNNSIPSFPNYDLGALESSPCDTILNIPTGLQPLHPSSFRISPNPVASWLNIVYQSSEDALFGMFDINGKKVAAGSLYHYFRNRLFDVSSLPAGIYFVTVTQMGKQVWSKKVVLAR